MRKPKRLNIISFLISFYFAVVSSYVLNLEGLKKCFIASFLLTIILYPIFNFILKRINIFDIKTKEEKVKKHEISIYLIITIMALLIYFIALYPGGSSPDTESQLAQALTNSYNNWHPVIHTFLFYRIPTLIVTDYTAVVIWQMAIIAIILSFVCYGLRKIGFSKKIVLLFLFLILLNPLNARMFTVVWKDIAYSLMLLILTILLMFITKSKGQWLDKKRNAFFLAIILFFTIAFRHNGIISFIFVVGLLFLLYYKRWKTIGMVFVSVLALFYIITGPIYNYLNIESHDSFTEMMGVPLNQISYIYNSDGEFTEDEWKTFTKFANLDVWSQNYDPINFNVIKWTSNGINTEYIDNNNVEFLLFYISLVKNNFTLAVNSYYHVTSSIWAIQDNSQGTYYGNDRYMNESGLIYKLSDKLNFGLNTYETWLKKLGIEKVFFGYGGSLFIIIISLAITSLKSKFYLKKYLPYIPALSNTLGIMLLITGGELRFVYSNILCAIPLLIYSLSDISSKCEKDDEETLLCLMFLKKTKNTALQFFRYLFVGGIAAVVNIGALYIFTDFMGLHYIISSILGFILGLIVNYALSKKFVFSTEKVKSKKKEFATYGIIGIIGLAIDTIFMYLLTSICGVYYVLSKIISTIITFIWNFTARKKMYKMEDKNEKL